MANKVFVFIPHKMTCLKTMKAIFRHLIISLPEGLIHLMSIELTSSGKHIYDSLLNINTVHIKSNLQKGISCV